MEDKEGNKLVLCEVCQKPIHKDDWTGISKELGWVHEKCIPARIEQIKEVNNKATDK